MFTSHKTFVLCALALLGILLIASCGPEGYNVEPAEPVQEPQLVFDPDSTQFQFTVVQPVNAVASSELVYPSPTNLDEQMVIREWVLTTQFDLVENVNAIIEQQEPQYVVAYPNWDRSVVAYQPLGEELVPLVVAVPARSNDPFDYSSPRLEQLRNESFDSRLVLGGMVLLEAVDEYPRGEYLFEWFAGEDVVCLSQLATREGTICRPPEPAPEIDFPEFDLFRGSLGICIKFDSRKCCF
jgi:hypothetical protein